jgi:N4-gp56 family major capsid protein
MEFSTGAGALGTSATNSYSGILNKVEDYFSTTLLMTAREKTILEPYATRSESIPTKQGIRQRWFKLNDLAAANELQEGVNPPPSAFTKSHIYADVKEYGDYVEMSSWGELTTTDPTLNSYSERQGIQAAKTWDLLIAAEIFAGTNVQYSGSGNAARTDLDTGDVISVTDLAAVVLTLSTNFAEEISAVVPANPNVGTTPIGRAYIAFSHRNMSPKIAALSGFIPYYKYPQQDALPNEIGSIPSGAKTIRFIETSYAPVFDNGSGVAVYPTLVTAKGFFGVTKISGSDYRAIIKDKSVIGGALERFGTMGWYGTYAAKRLDESFAVRIESTLA